MSHRLQPRRDVLVRLPQELDQVTNDVLVTAVEERSGNTSVTRTTSTTNAVNVVIDVGGKVIVDDVHDVRDIETTSSDGSSDHNGCATLTECIEGRLTLTLRAITVDGGGGVIVTEQEVGQHVGHALGFDEDEGQSGGLSAEKIKEDGALVVVLNVLDLLRDVLGGGANSADGKEDILLQEILSEHLDISGEGGREHERLALMHTGHILLLNDPTNLGLETHVQHTVSLVEDKVANVCETDATTLDKIDKTTRSGAEEIAAAFDLAELAIYVGTTVHDSGTDPGAIGEFTSFVMDLVDELSSGR